MFRRRRIVALYYRIIIRRGRSPSLIIAPRPFFWEVESVAENMCVPATVFSRRYTRVAILSLVAVVALHIIIFNNSIEGATLTKCMYGTYIYTVYIPYFLE